MIIRQIKKAVIIGLLISPLTILAQNSNQAEFANYRYGGLMGLRQFIAKEFKFRKPPVLDDVGRLYVDFIITNEGGIDSIVVWNNINDYMGEEIVRVLKLTNDQWIPGGDVTRFEFFPALTYYGNGEDLDLRYNSSKEKAEKFYSKGKVKNAIKAISKSINYYPVNSEDFELRAKCKKELGDLAGYEEDMSKAKRLNSFIQKHGERGMRF